MPKAARTQTSFHGGIWTGSAQGRFDDPAYATAMAICLNGIILETGAWTRRPGTQFAQTTRGGVAGRVIKYDFNGQAPYTVELTAGWARFRTGPNLATTNDATAVSSISTANPAVMTMATSVGWQTGDSGFFSGLSNPDGLLLDRVFKITRSSGTLFSLADAITGANLDGSTLAAFSGGTFNHIHEVTTPYNSVLALGSVRLVQADSLAVLLQGAFQTQVLTPTTQPSAAAGVFANFSLANAFFNDGPYLDPVTGGALVTPSATNGIISLTISFAAYDSTRAYKKGDFVTSSSVNYQSLVDANLNNTPVSSPSQWSPVSAGVAVGPNGFQQTDIGRLVRLFSEPAIWAVGTTYAAGNVVSYLNASTGAYEYWTSLVGSNVGNQPGVDLTKWAINATAGIWSWGKITALLNSLATSGGAAIGNMTGGGGIAAAFDGNSSQSSTQCAATSNTSAGTSLTSYVGYNFGSGKQVASAVVFPSTDIGFAQGLRGSGTTGIVTTVYLYGSNVLPANATNGTLLGSVIVPSSQLTALTIPSSDQSTNYQYIWITVVTVIAPGQPLGQINNFIAEIQFTAPTGSGTSGAGVNVQILGTALLYTTAIRVWRLGAFSNTTGWPTCGTWAGGRLYLGGAILNRWDASVANGVNGTTIDFTPTAPDGTVADSNAISYRFNAPDVSQILWMSPEDRGIMMGTQSGEWLVFASANNNVITPTSADARRVTRNGCANVEPRRTENTIVFVQKHQRKLLEGFADVFSGKFSAPNLSKNSRSLTQTGLQEIAYQQEIAPIIWARRGDGGLIGYTYKRETLSTSQGPTFCGAHQHTLGGGRSIVSICDAGSVDGTLDSLAMVSLDATTGIYHVEVMTNIFEDGSPIASAWFLDDAVAPVYSLNRQTQVLTLYGLWHLNGKTVQAFVNGFDAGDTSGINAGPYTDFTVTNGKITIAVDGSLNPNLTDTLLAPFVGAATLSVVVGFTYTSQGQPLRLADQKDTGSANGPAFGKMSRSAEYAALLQDTQGIFVGYDLTKKLHSANFKQLSGVMYAANQLKTGVHWESLKDNHDREQPQVGWQITRPLPATVCAIKTAPDTE